MSIIFPVLRRVVVSGYGIFENEQSSGIAHEFTQGVHVIAGINGLGKTTLLNILYRLLLGPKDMSKEDAGLASTKHELSNWRNRKYFANRVRDIRGAWAEAEITFGKKRVTVRRSLRTLEVEALSIDGVAEDLVSQDRYEELICELSHVASFFDFYAILRFIIFFLEDRSELIWDRRSQFDMFRLLFYDREAAREAAEAYDEAQRIDSNYRNERVPIRKAQAELDAYDLAEQSGLAAEVRAARRALAAAQDQNRDGLAAIDAALERADAYRLEREKARLDLEEARRAHEREEQLFYHHVFPDVGDTAKHVFLNLAAANGCLVCGSQSQNAAKRLMEYAARHECPICESSLEEQESLADSREFDQDALDRAAAKVAELRDQLVHIDAALRETEVERRELIDSTVGWASDVARHQTALNKLLADMGAALGDEILIADDDEQIAYKRQYAQTGELRLKTLEDARSREELRYIRIKDGQEKMLAQRLAATKGAFAKIAGHLLAEQCLLRETHEERRIGEEGEKIAFPILEVMMSSGVFTGSPSARQDASSVSESQREFIDLAFRMALIEAASDASSDAMLVIETPEASLDSLFVREAGELFRGFSSKGGTDGNVFIASTNLNNEEMIPALFGAVAPPPREITAPRDRDVLADGVPPHELTPPTPKIAASERRKHLINLLELSAPNAALRQHRDYYEKKLLAALYDDVPEDQRSSLFNPPPQQSADETADDGDPT